MLETQRSEESLEGLEPARERINALLIDDDPEDIALLRRLLARSRRARR